VFGAPGPADEDAELADGPAADLSPLSPLLSKAQLRKLQRRASRGGGGGPLESLSPAAGLSSPGQPQQGPGRTGKPGRSKAERRSRGSSGGICVAAQPGQAMEHEGPDAWVGSGLGLGDGGSPQQQDEQQEQLVGGDYANFERHTTGIGSRLLSKWGFGGSGAGLGRQQQGRAEPLQAVRRAKKLGLGAER
jgi:hypothetical protein